MRRAAASLLTLLAVSACGGDLDGAAEAAAECAHAVHGEPGLPDSDTSLDTEDVRVERSPGERAVTGRWSHPSKGDGRYPCVVVEDAGDRLRGLRVTDLSVEAAR